MDKRTRTLVIGATGFIGGHIAKQAVDRNWEVIGLRRNPQKTGHLNETMITWRSGNLYDRDSLINAMTGVDVVFHAGAFYPGKNSPHRVSQQIKYAQQQIDNVIDAVKSTGVKKLIYTSSLSTVFNPELDDDAKLSEDDIYIPGALPKSGYHETKILMEQTVLDASDDSLDVVVLNPTAVFGPGDINMSMGSLLVSIAKGWGIVWVPGWTNVVDVRDVAKAHISAVEQGYDGERYILGGTNLTLREAMVNVAKLSGKSPPKIKLPLGVIDAFITVSDLLPFISLPTDHLRGMRYWKPFDTTKAEDQLGLQTRSLETTIEDSLNWYRSQGFLAR